MHDSELETDSPLSLEDQPTSVGETEVFETSTDPLLELLGQWEEFHRRGEDPPPGWPGALDPGLRADLDQRIAKRKRLFALLRLPDEQSSRAEGGDGPYPAFPGHETLCKIGQGGMGAVYTARDTNLERIVAIKTIAEGRHATADQRHRFRDEARAVARLRHPNIIAIHAVGEHDDQPYLTLEFAEGGSLAERLAEKPMAPRAAAALIETLARAVHAAHLAGVVHRDLKPSNILLTAEGIPKVSDFGLAKLIDGDAARTVSGQVMGSPSFMAPEQAEGRSKQVGPGADIYALGAILYQALTGRPPFLGQTQLETLRLVVSNEVVSPRRLRPDVPRDLETICLKCLEKEPSKRYATAAALADDLNRYGEGRPIVARPASLPERAVRWCRRKPWVAASLALLVVGSTLSAWQAIRATWAERAARRAEATAQQERDRAQRDQARASQSAAEARATLNFFQNKVLAVARPKDQEGGLGVDVTVRAALDAAEPGIVGSFVEQPAVETSIRAALGESYYYLGEPAQAIRQFEQVVAKRRRLLGPDDPDTLDGMSNLARSYQAAGRRAEALPVFEETLRRFLARRGPDHPDTARAMNNLANAYVDAGRVAEALPVFEDALRRLQAGLGPDHPQTLGVMNDLAEAYRDAGRVPEALRLLEDALKRKQVKLGPDHPDTLVSLCNLAMAYRAADRLADARPLLEEALRRRRVELGPDHLDTLVSMGNLALAYHDSDRLPDALPLYQETLERFKAKLGPDHPLTLQAMNNLADAYRDADRLSDALRLYEETLERRRAKFGPDHPDTFQTMNNLAIAYREAKRDADALPLFEETLKRSRLARGDDHPNTLTSMNNLALVYEDAGRLSEALPLYEEALRRRRATLGPDHPDTLVSINNLAFALEDAGRVANALPLFEEVLRQRRVKLGSEDTQTLLALNNLARVTLTTKPASAESLAREALAIGQKSGRDDWHAFESHSLLGAALLAQGKYAEAESHLLQGYEGLEARKAKVPASSRKRLVQAHDRIIRLYDAWGRKDQAEAWRKKPPPGSARSS